LSNLDVQNNEYALPGDNEEEAEPRENQITFDGTE
jgi:hypothetical protein